VIDARRLEPGVVFAALAPSVPRLLYGVRLWVAVCLALWTAFYLELDNPSWAGTSAALVCQPVLGASLRKGWFRMVGTVIGAIAIVVLTACFPQSRVGFLIALAAWGAVCALVATMLRNFASYAAALAGYTAAIVAADELGLVGGTNGQAFTLAVARASEICIGIVCAGVVLASTDFGGARQRLGKLLAGLAVEISGGLGRSLTLFGAPQGETRQVRRSLIRRVSALDPIIDQAVGEISALRFHPHALQAAVDGLFVATAAWSTIARHLESAADSDRDAAVIRSCWPEELGTGPRADYSAIWQLQPKRLRHTCLGAVRTLVSLQVSTPSLRLLADHMALALLGIAHALSGLMVLEDPRRVDLRPRVALLRVPDFLPPILSALRAFMAIAAASLVWIATGWPGGATAMLWVAIAVLLFSAQGDAGYANIKKFGFGTVIGAVLATIIQFAVLPQQTTFAGFAIAIGLVLVPMAALAAQSWQTAIFTAIAANFIPLLGPANQMTYDTQTFYNSELALVGGFVMAVLAMGLIPPYPPALRAQRLLTFALRDLRHLASGAVPASTARWESRMYGRLSAMPDQAELLQGARLVAALSVGYELIRLRRIAGRFALRTETAAVCDEIARGNSTAAIEQLRKLDQALASVHADVPGASVRLRARGAALAIAESLAQHAGYFDAPA
jgi:uncharacterized membrane protein YccC